ncbi:P-loop containing nucleoside triphosphate hydrolase protein, partial [Ochromonadaceae sp. CCMP2298]
MTFFVANPTGRVLNRFSKDQNQVDEMLPLTFFSFLETLVYCVAAVLLVCITIPWLALLMPFLGAYIHVCVYYVATSREIKRYEAVTRSPIYADFSATLEGLPTLRAYKLEHRVGGLFRQQIDENSRPWFSFILAARWLGSRLDVETAVILGCVSFFAVWLRHSVDTGLLGFTLVYCSALSGLFQWMVRQSAEVENQMTAVERISAYAALPAEEGYKTDMPGQGQGQVGQGRLQILDLTATYRSDLPPVLRHITLDIPAGAKVGICGRTGSGKSSTLLALLRLNIIQGEVLLDGKSLLQMDLQAARSAVAVIPQDPHLFSCSVRFNIDPFGLYTDPQLWEALQDAHIADAIRQDASGLGLSMLVEEGGKNFSVGERQLISLARAILRRCRVVLMDEVTASIDYLTDRLIQQTIRTSPALRDATIITVAHRLRTIADSDLIAVISAGEVVEKGPPALLLSGEGGAGGGGGGSGCGGDG